MHNELTKLVDQILIPHRAFDEGLKRLNSIFKNYSGTETCIQPIIGESRSGKSRLLECFAATQGGVRSINGVSKTIITVRTPSTPTQKSLAFLILEALGDPLNSSRGTENQITSRIYKMIKNCGVKVIILDEIQHFVDRWNMSVVSSAADWLKNLVEDTKVILIIAGLPHAVSMINSNHQLAGRSNSPIKLPQFDWSNEDSRNEFRSIMGAFQAGLDPFKTPDLASEEMAFRFHLASRGLTGLVVKILREATWLAISNNNLNIDLTVLENSFNDGVWREGEVLNPFSRELELGTLNADEFTYDSNQIDPVYEKISKRGRKSKPELGVNAL